MKRISIFAMLVGGLMAMLALMATASAPEARASTMAWSAQDQRGVAAPPSGDLSEDEECTPADGEMGDEDVGNILWAKVKGRKLIDNQILLAQNDGSHPAIKTLGEFLCLIEETIGIARVEKHRAKLWMTKQRKHGGEVNRAPASAVDGDMFGSGAVEIGRAHV